MFLMMNKTIGHGMLASAFEKSQSQDCIFFCSGVSNSSEMRSSEFDRERELLIKSLKKQHNETFVYFSSILAPSESNAYYKHKLEIEQYIAKNSKKYLILRLPQVAGVTNNKTLLPFFVQRINTGKTVSILRECSRSIVDVEDVVKGFDALYNKGLTNEVLDFCPDYTFHPIELAEIIAEYLKKDLRFKCVDGSSLQKCAPSAEVAQLNLFNKKSKYLIQIVEKYADTIIRIS